jgi:hypothetical protein
VIVVLIWREEVPDWIAIAIGAVWGFCCRLLIFSLVWGPL